MSRSVAVIVGSLRKNSYSGMVANALIELAPKSLNLELIEIGDLPHYNADLEDEPPAAWVAFREKMLGFEAVLFVTPEYNRSVPGALKNALDVGSRPYGQSVWATKPAAVVSQSLGGMAGFGANHHLRQSLVFLDMPVMQQPEIYLGASYTLFDADSGKLQNDKTKDFLTGAMINFADWVEGNLQMTKAPPASLLL